jgi:hypothetical protein
MNNTCITYALNGETKPQVIDKDEKLAEESSMVAF